MRCWHMERPMTPVPIQPTRVLSGSASLIGMVVSRCVESFRSNRHSYSPALAPAMTVPLLRDPIVLVHGLLGYDEIRFAGLTFFEYFTGITSHLRSSGNRVLVPRMSPTRGVAERAEQLKQFLDRELPAKPVHLIAHSMGGLDSRYLITHLGMAERVRSLTTIGTPHRGSPFADWGIRRLALFLQPWFRTLGIPERAFLDLTTSACLKF